MTNKRKTGGTGLSILDIDKGSQTTKKTAQEIAKWCSLLPMADTGISAKKLFIQLTEITNMPLMASERYTIMELLRSPNKIICTALKRHYIEQRAPLTENKLIIANLRQTLLTLMADNYKMILEELHSKGSLNDEEKKFMATAIVRIYYYLNVLLICNYQIYSYTPDNLWHEVYLLYKYSLKHGLLNMRVPCQFSPQNQTSIMEAFMRIIILYATDPYQWRQREQHSLNKAIEMWALYPTIYAADNIPAKKAGVYIIDLEKDMPPSAASFRHEAITQSCIGIDLEKSVQHLKEIQNKIKSDHLKAKIENPNDPEFSVTAPTIEKLINIWSKHITRNEQRFPIQAEIKIVFGLNAAHYYLNDQQEFNPHPSNLQTDEENTQVSAKRFTNNLNLALYEVSEEIDEDDETEEKDMLSSTEADDKAAAEQKKQSDKDEIESAELLDEKLSKELLYHIYTYNIENINQHGFCIVIRDKSYPPFQAGEIVAFKNNTQHDMRWGVGAVRWLRRQSNGDFHIGVQIISADAAAGGLQIMRAEKPSSRLSRCLLIPENKEHDTPPMLITSGLPIQTNTVLLYTNNSEPFKATLTKEIDASGMYYQYIYSTHEAPKPKTPDKPDQTKSKKQGPPSDNEKTNTEFDKIWGDL